MIVSIVIPNYNGEELLRKNLPKVVESATLFDGKIEIIIVDDRSEDNSAVFVEEFIKTENKTGNIKLIQNKINSGFSFAVNKGVNEASGEIVVLLNTDVVPFKDFITPLIKHFKDEKVFAVGCMDESVEGNSTVQRGRGIGRWERGLMIHSKGSVDKKNTLWVSGGSGAFRKSIWEKLGGLDELYSPFYWEDIDLSFRAQKAGYVVLFEKESRVKHEHEKGIIKRKYSSFQIREISYRNQIFFVWLNITDIPLIFSHIIWMPYYIFSSLVRRDTAFLLGLYQALMKASFVWKSRIRRRNYFVKKDIDVLKLFAGEYKSR